MCADVGARRAKDNTKDVYRPTCLGRDTTRTCALRAITPPMHALLFRPTWVHNLLGGAYVLQFVFMMAKKYYYRFSKNHVSSFLDIFYVGDTLTLFVISWNIELAML